MRAISDTIVSATTHGGRGAAVIFTHGVVQIHNTAIVSNTAAVKAAAAYMFTQAAACTE